MTIRRHYNDKPIIGCRIAMTGAQSLSHYIPQAGGAGAHPTFTNASAMPRASVE